MSDIGYAKLVLAICGERYDGGWHIRRFAYEDTDMDSRVRDSNFVCSLINRLMGGKDLSSSWDCSFPDECLTRFFDVYLIVKNHKTENPTYEADYHRYNGCPSAAVEDVMEIYRAIRKNGIRPTKKQIEMRKKHKKEQLDREKKRHKFTDGCVYKSEIVDELNHRVKVTLVFNECLRNKVRQYENGDEYVVRKGIVFSAANPVNPNDPPSRKE